MVTKFIFALLLINKMLFAVCKCPANTTDLHSIHKLQYSHSEDFIPIGSKVLQGHITGDFYHFGLLINQNVVSFIIRFSDHNTIVWRKYYNLVFARKSICTSPDETILYFIRGNPFVQFISIYGYHADNGTIAIAKKISDSFCNFNTCYLVVTPDNFLYGAVDSTSDSQSFLFKYDPSNNTATATYFLAGNDSLTACTWLGNENVLLVSYSIMTDYLLMARVDIASGNTLWYKSMICTQIGVCTKPHISYDSYDRNHDIIYLSLSENDKIFFFTLNGADGTAYSIHIATDFGLVYNSYLFNYEKLFISAQKISNSSNYIFLYHISNDSFSEYKLNDVSIAICDILYVSKTSNLVLFGVFGSDAYVINSHPNSFFGVSEIIEETTQIFEKVNASEYQFLSVSVSKPPVGYITVSNEISPSLTNETMSIIVDEFFDLAYFLDEPTDSEYFSLMEGWSKTLPISLTCSRSGTTFLEHIIEDYENFAAPTWVTLDEVNNQLECLMPKVAVDTSFYFQIKTTDISSSKNFYKVVNLKVLNCKVNNCDLCLSDDASSCHTCSSGYELSNSKCEEIMPEDIQDAQTTTQVTIGVSMGLAAGVSIINLSSPIGIWIILNLFQMLMLLILTRAFIPETVKQYLLGMNFNLANLSFIQFKDIPYASKFYSWMEFNQFNDDLKYLEVNSGSTFINNIVFLQILLVCIIAHILVTLIYSLTKSKNGFCSELVNIIWKMMTFAIYIRLVLENLQFMLLCSFSEAYEFDLSTNSKKMSIFIAYIFIISCFVFYFLVIRQYLVTKIKLKRKYNWYAEEMFAGLKETNQARSYAIFLITRRIYLCIMLICFQDLNFILSVILFAAIQVPYFVSIILVRPFSQIANNIVEAVNELLLTILICLLLFYNQPNRWNNTIERIIIYLITGVSMLIGLIFISSLVLTIAYKCRKKCCTKDTRVRPLANSENNQSVAMFTQAKMMRRQRYRSDTSRLETIQIEDGIHND